MQLHEGGLAHLQSIHTVNLTVSRTPVDGQAYFFNSYYEHPETCTFWGLFPDSQSGIYLRSKIPAALRSCPGHHSTSFSSSFTHWACRLRLQTEADKRRGSSSLLSAASPHVTSLADLKKERKKKQKETMTHKDKPEACTGNPSAATLRCPPVVNIELSLRN